MAVSKGKQINVHSVFLRTVHSLLSHFQAFVIGKASPCARRRLDRLRVGGRLDPRCVLHPIGCSFFQKKNRAIWFHGFLHSAVCHSPYRLYVCFRKREFHFCGFAAPHRRSWARTWRLRSSPWALLLSGKEPPTPTALKKQRLCGFRSGGVGLTSRQRPDSLPLRFRRESHSGFLWGYRRILTMPPRLMILQ